jgi:YVTN family beta-propeller protein
MTDRDDRQQMEERESQGVTTDTQDREQAELTEEDLAKVAGGVYVTNSGSNTVSVIDTKTNTEIATIPVGDG